MKQTTVQTSNFKRVEWSGMIALVCQSAFTYIVNQEIGKISEAGDVLLYSAEFKGCRKYRIVPGKGFSISGDSMGQVSSANVLVLVYTLVFGCFLNKLRCDWRNWCALW